ncbi:hypothetical protein Ngar_c25110 [Candidatus Nitrososphaera gargensis Ga9.2]|uniref:Uncharacterized protein n=2 Tax=Candidatus Nitrososphaera gargensis TaxID=497727 RepID=K0INI5_NITGG|nr:hypothetical protein Ngar_c25110 [Candidatus Nitrososphaera gargensis Ga9.2]
MDRVRDWVLRLRPTAAESDMPSAHLVARIAMVRTDGTAMHDHAISNFGLTNVATEDNNTTTVFRGQRPSQ